MGKYGYANSLVLHCNELNQYFLVTSLKISITISGVRAKDTAATSVPEPMATPILALRKAGASFTLLRRT